MPRAYPLSALHASASGSRGRVVATTILAVIQTRFTQLMGIEHPVVLAGMAGATSPGLVAAVSEAGGLGILGATGASTEELANLADSIRAKTQRPFGLNLLLHACDNNSIRSAVEAQPVVLSTAWPRESQDLEGVKVMHMVPTVNDAIKAVRAGADVIVAQGTDGGGHVGLMGTVVIVPMVVRAVPAVPVLAAGGISDGFGLAAMLALGAEGVLLGTRFLATSEAPLHDAFKELIVESDGTDTAVTDITDILLGEDWPGALARVRRNRVVERWLGRPNELRRRRDEVVARMREARKNGDAEEAVLYSGQGSGLIQRIVPAAQVVADMVQEAEGILTDRMPGIVR